MATIVDALLVTLGLDVSGYKKGQKEAGDSLKKFGDRSAEETKKIEAQGKAMADGFNKVKNEILGLVAVAMGSYGVKSFFENMVNGQASLARSSRDLGVSVKQLDAWSAAATSVGGTAEGFKSSMQSVLGAFESYARGGGGAETVQAFQNLHVAIADASGAIRPMKDWVLDLAGAMEGLPQQTKLMITAQMHMDAGTSNLLMNGRKWLDDLFKKYELSSKITEASAAAAAKAQGEWALFRFQIGGVGKTIFAALLPALESGNALLLRFSGWVSAHSDDIGKFFADLAGWAVSAFKDGFSWLKENRGEIEGFFRNLATSFKDAFQWVKDNRGEIKGFFVDLVSVVETLAKALNGIGKFGKWLFSSPFDPKPPKAPEAQKQTATGSETGAGRRAVNPGVVDVKAKLPRGVRNNNPGNLNFAGQEGATREDGPGRFAKFESMEAGIGALVKQLKIYASRGVNTIKAIVEKYAPASENNVGAYISALTKETGLNADEKVDLSNAEVLKSLLRGITNHENGRGYVSDAQITGGIRVGAAAARPRNSRSVSTSTSETNINGPITIHTQATDADGIARDLYSSLQQESKLMNLATSSQY